MGQSEPSASLQITQSGEQVMNLKAMLPLRNLNCLGKSSDRNPLKLDNKKRKVLHMGPVQTWA